MSGFVGSCLSMCPQNERTMRINTNRVHMFEKDAKRDILVKEFIRAGAGNKVDPAELRPAKVLLETTMYLVNKLCDEAENFCPATNLKHAVECLNKLLSIYETAATGRTTDAGEFLSYHLLTCFGNPEVIMHALTYSHLRKDKMVKVALLMNMAWIKGNYFRVLKLAGHLTPLQACIFHHKLNVVRMSLVRVLSAAYSVTNVSFPLDTLTKILIFRDSEALDCQKLLESCGANVSEGRKKFVINDKMQTPSLWVESLIEGWRLQHLLLGSVEDEVTDLVGRVKISP